MGTLTFLEWLRKQVTAEGHEGILDMEVDAVIELMSSITLLEYFAMYQRETAQ